MRKSLFLISLIFLVKISTANAATDEELSEKCLSIVNYKLENNIHAMLDYYHPKIKQNEDSVAFITKEETKRYKRIQDKGKVLSVNFSHIEEMKLFKGDKEGFPFSPIKKKGVFIAVEFSSEKRPKEYFCEFGLEENSNKWFIQNII